MSKTNKRRWYQFSLGSLFVLTTLVALWLGVGPRVRAHWAVQRLTNDDVEFNLNWSGPYFRVENELTKEIHQLGPHATPALLRALNDPNRFVAAHIMLTVINEDIPLNGLTIPYGIFRPLRFSEDREGALFHPDQIPELREYWREKLRRGTKSDRVDAT